MSEAEAKKKIEEERLENDSSSEDELVKAVVDAAANAATKAEGPKFSCDIIRRNVTMFLATEEMSLAKFLRELGDIAEEDYSAFMALRGKEKGKENPFYPAAHAFFEERERKEKEERKLLSQQANRYQRKRKSEMMDGPGEMTTTAESELVSSIPQAMASIATAGSSSSAPPLPMPRPSKREWVRPEIDVLIDQVNQIELPDNEHVYDDCDEIRRKIAVFVEEEAGSITKFSFAIKTTPSVVNRFLARKGKDQGAGSEVYKKSYFFFEKLRVLRNEGKSKHRLQSEKDYPEGFVLKNPKGEK